MYTLTTAQIFSNLHFYQENYLNIIHSSETYFIEVSGAFIHIVPFKKQPLYLGDLLQLWFAEKWSIQTQQVFNVEEYLAGVDLKQSQQKAFIFSIQGNVFTGSNQTEVWLSESNQFKTIIQNSMIKNFCEYLNCERPKKQFRKNLTTQLV